MFNELCMFQLLGTKDFGRMMQIFECISKLYCFACLGGRDIVSQVPREPRYSW